MVSRSKAFEALRRLLAQKVKGDDTLPDLFFFGEEEGRRYSDRAAALVSGAIVESTLQAAITSQFISTDLQEVENLFSERGPLATFSAKIHIGYALGIYGPKTKQDLTCMRHVRNVFAHSLTHLDFSSSEIIAACDHLRVPYPDLPMGESKEPLTARQKYIWTAKCFCLFFYGHPRGPNFEGYEHFRE